MPAGNLRPGAAARRLIPVELVAYKVLTPAEWAAWQVGRIFRGSASDIADGFIHLSLADQLPGTLDRHYAGQEGLVLVAVDLATLGDALRWEAARGGALFPHLYGALDPRESVWVKPLPLGPDGQHVFPALE